MTSKSKGTFGKSHVGEVPAGTPPLSPIAAGVDASVAPMPEIPRGVRIPARSDVTLVFTTGRLVLGVPAPIRTQAGGPTIRTVEMEGRQSRMSQGPPEAFTAEATVIAHGAGAQAAHDQLMAHYLQGMVFRLYGPMVGPAPQGVAWMLSAAPDVDADRALFYPSGDLWTWTAKLSMQQWVPEAEIASRPGSRVATGRARQRAVATARMNLSGGADFTPGGSAAFGDGSASGL